MKLILIILFTLFSYFALSLTIAAFQLKFHHSPEGNLYLGLSVAMTLATLFVGNRFVKITEENEDDQEM
ncbi:hypothetical protein [Larkinella terrae]|uniref:Uncharacterized protein n=1 Tax=Larkinella terrae TaxID=2025311 RepID=A0A7K0ENQ1_9BACT|nr:hypothetical protein [Larkinella terrae]MRS63352.1 hypothetical protein [Larkinella terrae]